MFAAVSTTKGEPAVPRAARIRDPLALASQTAHVIGANFQVLSIVSFVSHASSEGKRRVTAPRVKVRTATTAGDYPPNRCCRAPDQNDLQLFVQKRTIPLAATIARRVVVIAAGTGKAHKQYRPLEGILDRAPVASPNSGSAAQTV